LQRQRAAPVERRQSQQVAQPHCGHTGWPFVSAQRIAANIASAAGAVIPSTVATDSERAAAVRRKCWPVVRRGMAISNQKVARVYSAGARL
jgi:hypothetical protein